MWYNYGCYIQNKHNMMMLKHYFFGILGSKYFTDLIFIDSQWATANFVEVLISEPTPRVEIIVHKFKKPFLGGYRQPLTGFEFHNATTQTLKGKNKDWNSFSDGKCCILQPAFGCCTLQTLVKICIINIFCA